jgi:hypothetical protein
VLKHGKCAVWRGKGEIPMSAIHSTHKVCTPTAPHKGHV